MNDQLEQMLNEIRQDTANRELAVYYKVAEYDIPITDELITVEGYYV